MRFGRHMMLAVIGLVLAGCVKPETVQRGSITPQANITPAAPRAALPEPGLVPPPGTGWVIGGYQSLGEMWLHLPTRSRSGNTVRIWILYNNLGPVRESGTRSNRTIVEYDCRGRRERIVHIIGYSGLNGSGSVVASGPVPVPRWDPVAPGTIGSDTVDVACGR